MKKRKTIFYYINPILTRIKAVYMLNELYISPFQLRRNGRGGIRKAHLFTNISKKQPLIHHFQLRSHRPDENYTVCNFTCLKLSQTTANTHNANTSSTCIL